MKADTLSVLKAFHTEVDFFFSFFFEKSSQNEEENADFACGLLGCSYKQLIKILSQLNRNKF